MKKFICGLTMLLLAGYAMPVAATGYTLDEYLDIREEFYKKNKEVELTNGEWVIGKDIQPGRYHLTTEKGFGDIIIYDEKNITKFLDSLGRDEYLMIENDSITLDLYEGYRIEIIDLDKVLFTPYKTKMYEDQLPNGIWVVGADIEPGTYIATPADEQSAGTVTIKNERGYVKLNENLGVLDLFDIGVEEVELELKENYVIEVSGMQYINLEKQ